MPLVIYFLSVWQRICEISAALTSLLKDKIENALNEARMIYALWFGYSALKKNGSKAK
jgi:hypothetical protein